MPGQDGDTRTATVVLDASINPYSTQLKVAEADTNHFASAVDRLDAKLDGLNKRAGRKLIQLSAADVAALGGATATAAGFERQLGTLNATAAITPASMHGIKGAVEGAFVKFPGSRTQVVALTEAVSNLGITGERDIGKLVATFIKMGAATGEPINELADGTIKLSRLMGTTEAEQIGNYANAVLTVSKNSGVSATGVLAFAQNIAPLARQAGIGQAAVIGISAAFSKAGADGYVAGNTFNSIVGDITQLTQSGSPELAKYANLIGVTVSQFKQMDKTTAIERIFSTIAHQGPKAITTLNQLGIDGVRAQSAIAGVVQSGNLQQNIAEAMGSAHDQRNLTAGSKAAFAGLSDSLATLRNNFTQFGTEIGTSFLRPLDAAVTVVNRLFSAINQLIKPFAPLIALLAGTAGVIGAVGGMALSAAGVIGSGALLRTVLRSGPRRALREGVQAGRGVTQGNESYTRFNAGTLPLRAALPYRLGRAVGAGLGPRQPGPAQVGIGSQAVRAFVRAPFRVAAGLANQQADFLRNATRNDYARTPYRGQAGSVRDSFRASVASARAENAANAAHLTTLRAVTREAGLLGASFGRLTAQTARTGLGLAGGAAGRGIGAAGSLLSSAMFSPLGLIGLPVAMGLYSHAQDAAKSNITDDQYLNPVAKYNDALGLATTNLATFSAAVNTAATGTANLNGVTAASSMKDVTTVSRSDIANVQGQKSSDETVSALAGVKGAKTDAGALAQLARSYGMTDPRQVQMFKNNALAAGFDPSTITKALSNALATRPDPSRATDFTDLAHAVQATEGVRKGWLSPLSSTVTVDNASKRGGIIRQSALSQIGTDYNTNTAHGEEYAAQKRLADEASYFGSYADSFKGRVRGGKDNQERIKRKELANALASTFKGSSDDYLHALDKVDFTGLSSQQRQQAILKVVGTTAEGRNALGAVTTTDVGQFAGTLKALYGAGQTNASSEALKATGPTGTFALANKQVQFATQNVGDANAAYRGTKALADNALKNYPDYGAAADALDRMKGAIQNVNDPLYQMADAAKQMVERRHSYLLPTVSRGEQAQASAGAYRAAQTNYARSAAANGGTASPDAAADLQSKEGAFQQQKEAQRQYLLSIFHTAQQYGISMQRAQEDRDRTIYRQHRDFEISMAQSQADHDKSVFRAHRDFLISMEHAETDYNTSVFRSKRDFGIAMTRQALASAKSIYDPFTRVSAQYTADAGTTVQNLEDQNQRIAAQLEQLRKLKGMGLSQGAIDTLQLSDPGKAQQVNNLVDSLAQNPGLIKQINQAVKARVSATAALTQTSFSETFRNTVADFAKQLRDTAADYEKSRARAAEAQRRGLSDMATDYQTSVSRAREAQRRAVADMSTDYRTMVRRSGQDLALAMTEIYGSYANVFGRTMAQVNKGIAKYAPEAASVIQSNLDKIKLPEFMDPNYQGGALPGTVGGKDAKGRTILSDGSTGPFDASKYVRLRDASKAGHALGGISLKEHTADFSEGNRPELMVPLDTRGLNFMTGFTQQVTTAMLRQLQTSQYPGLPRGGPQSTGPSQVDLSTQFTGDITIMANDTETIKRELAAEARLRKLRSPARSAAGVPA